MKSVVTASFLAEHLQGRIKEINVSFHDVVLNYATAHALAVNAAGDAMLLAWYDGKKDVG